MRTHAMMFLAALVAGVACAGEPAPGDAGGADAAQTELDSGPAVSDCARDRDCDDDRFCNGAERCLPGDPAADARGGVAAEPPCPSSRGDDREDRCESCSAAESDRDGDGDPSTACGGTDCDDDDGRRFGGAVEVCDAMHVDEDCDETTLHDSSTPGVAGDRDGDGHVDRSCANVVDGEELGRGDDCDDTDPAVHVGAPERCNGVDDDCDGAIDEDFECVQTSDEVGTNMCGRDGIRRCSATCDWLDPDYVRPETLESCDYCDDSGVGFPAERDFARTLIRHTLPDDPALDVTGVRPPSPICPSTVWYSTLVDPGTSNSVGGTFLGSDVTLGYVPLSVSPRQRAWLDTADEVSVAVVVYKSPGSELLGSAAEYGLRLDRQGVAAILVRRPSDNYRLTIRSFDGSGTTFDAGRHSTGDVYPATPEPAFEARVYPDDPASADDDTAVEILVNGAVVADCSNVRADSCGVTFSPSERVRVGLIGASVGGTGTAMWCPVIPSDVLLEDSCPP